MVSVKSFTQKPWNMKDVISLLLPTSRSSEPLVSDQYHENHPKKKQRLMDIPTTKSLPSMKSIYLKPSREERMVRLRKSLLDFAIQLIREDFQNIVCPIKPYTNPARYSHQTPQAIRIFFAKEAGKVHDGVVLRYIYGPSAVLATTGYDLSEGYKVRPFSDKLNAIVDLLVEELKEKLSPSQEVDFNFLEIKLYQGQNMFKGVVDSDGKALRDDCNRKLNFHNDLQFDEFGVQDKNDTVDGRYPIAAVTVGAPRNLEFIRVRQKIGENEWFVVPRKEIDSSFSWTLRHGSIWVLMPQDEIPKRAGDYHYKTQHGARMIEKDGISMAFVFRKIKETSTAHFCNKTHQWRWELSNQKTRENAKQFSIRTREEFKKLLDLKVKIMPELMHIQERILSFLESWKN